MRLTLIILYIGLLQACSWGATTPLVIAGLGITEYAQFKSDIRERAEACQASEEDLLPQSVDAISKGNTEKIIRVYLSIYNNEDLPANMQAESIYQIGLIHMNEYNQDRDDDQAIVYFNRLKTEYPDSQLCAHVDEHLAIIENRRMNSFSYDADTLLAFREAVKERAHTCVAEEAALLPLSVEAISHKQASKAVNVYLDMVKDTGLASLEREQALYQVGLIYMNKTNVHKDNYSALYYFKQLLSRFPDSPYCIDAKGHVARLEASLD